jgi:adenine-specific DNA methylase
MSYISAHELTEKKRLGVFYTPTKVSRILCDWAIRASSEKILEPSFGGCGFLEASADRLKKLGVLRPNQQLFGCDIDWTAFQHLTEKIGPATITERFILSDFLQLDPSSFDTKEFEVIIGNPPYVSHHNMDEGQKRNAYRAIEAGGFVISAKASLWAYFLLHSLQFLKAGGRMAWVLPSSFLYADYANEIRRIFPSLFSRTLVASLGERIFESEGTDEHTALLLCEGYLQGPATAGLELCFAESTSKLETDLKCWQAGHSAANTFDGKYSLSIMSPEVAATYNALANLPSVVKFGEIANVLIGIVTGDNKYFVIDADEAKKHHLTKASLRNILAKFNMAPGLILNEADILRAKKDKARCLLVDTSGMRKTSRTLRQYLAQYPEDKKQANKTFAKRGLWHQPHYGEIPDAFFPYMHHTGPRLVLNEANVTSTNTIHRVFFEGIPRYKKRLVSISLLTTFSQISAEIEGRCYGSGVLKHEPSEVKRILLLIPDNIEVKEVNEVYSQIDRHIRANELVAARTLADHFILRKTLETNYNASLQSLNSTLEDLRSMRHKTQKG